MKRFIFPLDRHWTIFARVLALDLSINANLVAPTSFSVSIYCHKFFRKLVPSLEMDHIYLSLDSICFALATALDQSVGERYNSICIQMVFIRSLI